MIAGHGSIRRMLEENLPHASLLTGPDSIGKRTLAWHVVQHWGVPEYAVLQVSLDAAAARTVVQFAGSAMPARPFKVAILDLTGASEQAQNVLLKVLEEPPPGIRFILLSSRRPLPTIVSRCVVYRLGLLSDESVAGVLQTLGVPPEAAQRAAPAGRGRVAPALEAAVADDTRARGVVSAVLKAGVAQDSEVLELAFRNWESEVHTRLLAQWAGEAATGRWQVYAPSFAPGVTALQARRVMEVLARYPGAKLAAPVAVAAAFFREA